MLAPGYREPPRKVHMLLVGPSLSRRGACGLRGGAAVEGGGEGRRGQSQLVALGATEPRAPEPRLLRGVWWAVPEAWGPVAAGDARQEP